ncbi:MAG: DUF4286 family protein [Acidobacteriota bacterium]|nr:DUF4286 family protein [Acidobacteriota bacterium]
MEKTVIYEITAIVEPKLVEKYEKYMRERHIPDLLATGYFRGAKFTFSSGSRYRILYEAQNMESLNKYLEKEAPRLRADFLAHFPTGIELSREIWTVAEDWQEK